MIRRIKNLWAWSALDPYELGKETGRALAQAINEPADIVFPNRTQEIFNNKEDATIDDLI